MMPISPRRCFEPPERRRLPPLCRFLFTLSPCCADVDIYRILMRRAVCYFAAAMIRAALIRQQAIRPRLLCHHATIPHAADAMRVMALCRAAH